MGCGASSYPAAPYLCKYYNAVEAYAKDEMKRAFDMVDGGNLFDMMDPVKMNKMQEEAAQREKKFKEETTGLLEKSFEFHDKNAELGLDQTESKAFFSHLVDLSSGFEKAIAAWSCKVGIEKGMKAMQAMASMMGGGSVTAEQKKAMKDAAAKNVKDFHEKIDKAVAEYKKDKDNRDKKAFELLDVNKDGKLLKNEFLAAFDVDGSKNSALIDALGLNCGEMKQPDMQMPMGDCPMQ
jgi:hypothetical protein